MLSGIEWLVDAFDCDPDKLRDGAALRAVCQRVIDERQLHVVGTPHWHQFPWPGGWTGLYLLSESHLTCHTFPEAGLASFSLYCCRPRPEWPWQTRLAELLTAREVSVRSLERGMPSLSAALEPTDP